MLWVGLAIAAVSAVLLLARRRRPQGPAGPARLDAVAAGWQPADADLADEERARGAYRMWRHGKGHELRVFFIEPPPGFSPQEFLVKMFLNNEVAGPFQLGAFAGVRFLQNISCSHEDHDHGEEVVTSVNYAIIGGGGIHLVSAVVPWSEQQGADRRIRSLIEAARWVELPAATAR